MFEKQRSPRSQPARPNPPVPTPRPFPRMTLPPPQFPTSRRRRSSSGRTRIPSSRPSATASPPASSDSSTSSASTSPHERATPRGARGDGSQPARAADVRAARRLRHDDGGDRAARARPDVSRTADASSSSSIRRRRRLPGRRRRATRDADRGPSSRRPRGRNASAWPPRPPRPRQPGHTPPREPVQPPVQIHPNPNPNANPTDSPRRRKPTTAPPRVTTAEPPMGSLMDDVLPEEGGGWRPYELPRELSDARVQERLAEYIVGVVRGGGGGIDAGSPGGWGGSGGLGTLGGSGAALGVGVGGVGVVDGASSSPGAARAGAAERGVHLTDRDVEELTSQLWDDAELGALLAPLLGPAGGGERNPRVGGGTLTLGGGTTSAGPSPLGARGRTAGGTVGGGRVGVYSRGGVEGDAFADPPAPAAVAHRVGSKRRKGIAPAKSRAVPSGARTCRRSCAASTSTTCWTA